MDKIKKPSILQVNLLYLFLAIAFINIGALVQSIDVIKGLLFTEYILILIPSLLLILIMKVPIKKFLRLNKISFKQILLIIIITIFTYPMAVFLQGIFLTLLDSFTDFIPNQIPTPNSSESYLYGLFVMAITPGICEEFMFRGVILNAYDKLGYKKSIIITAALFGMFHFTLVNFIGPFVLGIVFGIMVYKTNSIYTSMIAHSINNAIALSILYFVNKYSYNLDEIAAQETSINSTNSILVSLFLVLGLLFICFFIVKTSLKHLGNISDHIGESRFKTVEETNRYTRENNLLNYLPIGIVVLLFFYMNIKYIITLV